MLNKVFSLSILFINLIQLICMRKKSNIKILMLIFIFFLTPWSLFLNDKLDNSRITKELGEFISFYLNWSQINTENF
ncbi:hypothetical protein BpHYR1_052316 [Brachionus plicatilis]|uniref:Uncharacterized protein n=1 Tax=Brachionus plicatilis TaxID=10195 RepID=A0A3M7T331_BRAPC|nr:hypothetical protein BpHYR1_052316 [Brachionus plicatilis]